MAVLCDIWQVFPSRHVSDVSKRLIPLSPTVTTLAWEEKQPKHFRVFSPQRSRLSRVELPPIYFITHLSPTRFASLGHWCGWAAKKKLAPLTWWRSHATPSTLPAASWPEDFVPFQKKKKSPATCVRSSSKPQFIFIDFRPALSLSLWCTQRGGKRIVHHWHLRRTTLWQYFINFLGKNWTLSIDT